MIGSRRLFHDDDDDSTFRRRPSHSEMDLDITPMIDVTFLLLIFFMVASTMQATAENDIPRAKHGVGIETELSTVISIRLPAAGDAEPLIYLGEGATESADVAEGSERIERPTRGSPSRLKKLLLACFSGLFGLLLGEGICRVVFEPIDYLKPVVVEDDVLGHRIRAGSAGHDAWGPQESRLDLDAAGIGHDGRRAGKEPEKGPVPHGRQRRDPPGPQVEGGIQARRRPRMDGPDDAAVLAGDGAQGLYVGTQPDGIVHVGLPVQGRKHVVRGHVGPRVRRAQRRLEVQQRVGRLQEEGTNILHPACGCVLLLPRWGCETGKEEEPGNG